MVSVGRAFLSFLFLGSLISPQANADTFTLDLTSPQYFNRSASTGLWNTVDGRIQAALVANGNPDKTIDFGDGSDGDFNDGPAQTGITVTPGTPGTITFDTTVKSEYQFTSFTLTTAFNIEVTGSNPLRIRVLGDTWIEGNIVLDGADGSPNSNSAIASGGTGIAGGSNGGRGGFATSLSHDGSPSAPGGKSGTRGSAAGTFEYGGGGGGCRATESLTYNASAGYRAGAQGGPFAGGGGTCVASSTVAQDFDHATTPTFSGGAGGGGGGFLDAGADQVGGGGGGGGGGAIQISSLGDITLNGTISARGGKGGNYDARAANTDCGAGGGGGAGGSVWIQSKGIFSGTGSVDITGGTGGVTTAPNLACNSGDFDGGQGSKGVFRADAGTNNFPGGSIIPDDVDQSYSTAITGNQSYQIVSSPIDFGSNEVAFESANETIGCGTDGTLSVGYQGSNDGASFGSSVSSANISQLSGFRYLRILVSISTQNVPTPNPPCLTGLTITHAADPGIALPSISDIRLQGGLYCGTTNRMDASPKQILGDLFMIGLAGLVPFIGRGRRRWRKASTA